jgi:hypothetical protein
MGNLQAVKLDLRQPGLHFHYGRPRYKLPQQSGPTWDTLPFRKLRVLSEYYATCVRGKLAHVLSKETSVITPSADGKYVRSRKDST